MPGRTISSSHTGLMVDFRWRGSMFRIVSIAPVGDDIHVSCRTPRMPTPGPKMLRLLPAPFPGIPFDYQNPHHDRVRVTRGVLSSWHRASRRRHLHFNIVAIEQHHSGAMGITRTEVGKYYFGGTYRRTVNSDVMRFGLRGV